MQKSLRRRCPRQPPEADTLFLFLAGFLRFGRILALAAGMQQAPSDLFCVVFYAGSSLRLPGFPRPHRRCIQVPCRREFRSSVAPRKFAHRTHLLQRGILTQNLRKKKGKFHAYGALDFSSICDAFPPAKRRRTRRWQQQKIGGKRNGKNRRFYSH